MVEKENHQTQIENVVKYYNLAQKFYERLWYSRNRGLGLHYGFWTGDVNNLIDAIVKENEILADLVKIKPGEIVLDAGCGVGGSGLWLAENRAAHVVGVNIVDKQLRIARKYIDDRGLKESNHLVRADYQCLPFIKDGIDVFWSLESIEHSDDPESLVEGAYRALKKGGRAVIAGTFKGSRKPTPRQEEQLNIGFRAAGAFNDFRTSFQVAELMSDVGFENIHRYDVTNWVMPSAAIMRARCTLGLPFARLGNFMRGFVSQTMVDNTAWGTYQEALFKNNVTSYDILVAEKL